MKKNIFLLNIIEMYYGVILTMKDMFKLLNIEEQYKKDSMFNEKIINNYIYLSILRLYIWKDDLCILGYELSEEMIQIDDMIMKILELKKMFYRDINILKIDISNFNNKLHVINKK